MKIGILTLGCRVNQYESQAIAEQLELLGYEIAPFEDDCDVYVINTCTVTAESDRKSKQFIGRAISRKKSNSNIIVCVIGCFTQNLKQNLKDSEIFKLGDIDIIGGNSDKSKIPYLLHDFITKKDKNKINLLTDMDFVNDFDDISLTKSNNVRAYLKVQDGCNNFCTYCIVPIVRGRVRSKPIEKIAYDLTALYKTGYREVVFCGIEISAYGQDSGIGLSSLADLATEIGFQRVRFGSMNPTLFFDDSFAKKLSENSSVMPHFHLSIQSASDNVLHNMGRNYTSSQLQNAIDCIYKYFPDATLSCDLICGFPGENVDDFNSTLNFVANNKIIHCHIFPYSRRQGTLAATFANQISTKEKKGRCATLQNIANHNKSQIFKSYSGTYATVLIENKKDGFWFGHTETFLPVAIRGNYLPGDFVKVKLSDEFCHISNELSFIIDSN